MTKPRSRVSLTNARPSGAVTSRRDVPPREATPPFPSRRVLCAHRRGPYGVNRLNRLVERRLREVGAISDDEYFVGRPIIVTRNDRHTGLSNGDTGVVVDAGGRHQVWFPELDNADGRFLVSPSRLPQHESFFALTVHRAQGSEYDEVLFVPGDARLAGMHAGVVLHRGDASQAPGHRARAGTGRSGYRSARDDPCKRIGNPARRLACQLALVGRGHHGPAADHGLDVPGIDARLCQHLAAVPAEDG